MTSFYYYSYDCVLQSEFDLSAVGLDPVKKSSYSSRNPLTISNMGRLECDHGYVNNQTMLNSSSGYYFKKNIGLFKFVCGDEIKVFIDYDEFDTDVINDDIITRGRFVFQQYIEKDTISVNGFLMFPEPVLRYSTINMPSTSIMNKSKFNIFISFTPI